MTCWNCGAVFIGRFGSDDLAPIPSLSFATQQLMRTNIPPTDAEISALRDFTASGRRRVDALDAQIAMLRATIARLTSERDNLDEQVDQYLHVLSPARRVPPELICEIFSWTLPCTRSVAGSIVTQAPWYLGHISRPWREIALGFPPLWSSILIYHSTGYPHEKVSPLAMVETQLIRSSNALLRVEMEWLADTPSDAAPFMEALLPHSNRWGSFRFLCPEHSDCHAFLELLRPAKGQLSQLSVLDIVDRGDDDPADSLKALDIFSIAPSLREVFFADPPFHYYTPRILIPWEQITRYRGIGTVEQLLDILRRASALVEGVVGLTDLPVVGALNNPIITLSNLCRLYLGQSSLLAHLAAPRLEYLSCHERDSVVPFLQRSCCHLTTLVLAGHYELFTQPPVNAIALLQNTPSLRNLVLQTSSGRKEDNNNVLAAMTVTGTADDLCPTLDFLAYGSTHGNAFSSDVFLAMILSRLQPNRKYRLSSLRVLSRPSEDAEEFTDWMEVLLDEGLDVELLDDPFPFVEQARHSFIIAR
ncbi:hypothetical protein DFH06DRAFT_1302931 [Mycena polygramma]|nr:hypothetical protein DFH06DRAFT_1302931 [Mycena polygramma]